MTIEPLSDHKVIWLSPWCAKCDAADWGSDSGRMWCEDAQDECPECGKGWVCYTLAALGKEPA